jgi:hypothetical protein
MNGILDAACEVDECLRKIGLPYCLIGGIALQRWGQPRTTLDVDVTVMAELGSEDRAIRQLLSAFEPRIADAAEFALQSRVVLLRTTNHVGVDVALGALPFESRMVARSTLWSLDDIRSLRTCSAEDLLVQKAFAGRDQDWVDIQRVLESQRTELDRDLVLQELRPLAELSESHDAISRLEQLFRSADNDN